MNQDILNIKMRTIMNVLTWHVISLPLLVLLICIPLTSGFSQEITGSNNLESIERILDSDGSIDPMRARSGSFSPEGFAIDYQADGQPVFRKKQDRILAVNPDDARWDNKFGLGGFDGYINAMAIAANGNIYVGGNFNLLNGDIVTRIAMWDGAEWHSLGKGIAGGWQGGSVYAIAVDQDKVYVGGDFTEAGEVQANNIAMWDGVSWYSLGSGMNGQVYAIAIDGGNVYAGGDNITEAGGVAVKNIAKWDGQNWSAMGNGVYNYNWVFAIVANNDTVYAGGDFKEAGEDTVNNIAYWDGSKWNAMGSGTSGRVQSLAYENGILYAGGSFKMAGGDTVNSLAQWDGQKWSTVGKGVNMSVSSIAAVNGDVYIGGNFMKADTVEISRIAKWDGEKWHSFAGGIGYSSVNAIAVDGSNIYAGGDFKEVDGKQEKYFAQWDGQTWSGPGKIKDQSVNSDVYAIAIDGNDVYVGGTFTYAGGDSAQNIAKWDGENWSALGAGLNGKVFSLAVGNGNLYAGGSFSKSGDLNVRRIAKWDGEKWSAMGTGMNNPVYAVAVNGEDVYVGGNFSSADTIWAKRIARWDGEAWHALGGDGSLNNSGGLDGYMNSYVTSIAVDRDTIYVGGYFSRAFYQDSIANVVNVRSVAKWDGEKWHAAGSFGNILQQIISSIVASNGIIYAAGIFPRAGMPKANKVVRWDGVEWTDVGDETYHTSNSSTGGKLNALALVNGRIYVGGAFNLVGDKPINYIAEWNGQEWLPLGSGLNYHAYALATDNDYLYAGGLFDIAGDKGSSGLARYNISGAVGIKQKKVNSVENYFLFQNYPNPFNPATVIRYQLPIQSQVDLSIYNVLGQKVAALVSRKQPAGQYQVNWDASGFSSGVYFYQLKTGNQIQVRKMMLLR